jgi:protein NRD1
MLTSFKEKLNAPSQSKTASAASLSSLPYRVSNHLGLSVDQSTTPPGSPPSDIQRTLGLQQSSAPAAAAPAAPNTSSILAALANMARQQNAAASAANPSAQSQNQDSLYKVPNAQNNPAQQLPALNQSLPLQPTPPPVNVPAPGATFASQIPGANGGAQNFASNQPNPYAAAPPMLPPTTLDPAVQQQLVLIKTLSDAGIAPDQIAGVIARLGSQGGAAGGLLGAAQFPAQNANANANAQNGPNGWGARPDESRDRSGYHEGARSPGRYRRRSRSASPSRAWNARDSPASRRRDEAGYDYGRDSPGRNRDDRGRGGRAGRGNEYRQRSPPRRGRSPTPPRPHGGEKWVGHDATIPKGHIKGMATTISHPSLVSKCSDRK